MKNYFFAILCSALLFCSCNNHDLTNSVPERKQINTIDIELIPPTKTRSEANTNDSLKGYLCTSKSSSLRLEVYPSENNMEAHSYMVDKNGSVLHLLKFKIDSFASDGICKFTALNELNEPGMSGVYDTINSQIEITDIYENNVVTRAAVAMWGCSLSIGIVGAIWSTAAGMVSAGAGFVVGLAYTAMGIAMCDGL